MANGPETASFPRYQAARVRGEPRGTVQGLLRFLVYRRFALTRGASSLDRRRFRMRLAILSAASILAVLGSAQAQDAAAGEKVFLQCRACHQVGDAAKNAVGPVLNGLFGRKAGMVEGYTY